MWASQVATLHNEVQDLEHEHGPCWKLSVSLFEKLGARFKRPFNVLKQQRLKPAPKKEHLPRRAFQKMGVPLHNPNACDPCLVTPRRTP